MQIQNTEELKCRKHKRKCNGRITKCYACNTLFIGHLKQATCSVGCNRIWLKHVFDVQEIRYRIDQKRMKEYLKEHKAKFTNKWK